MAKIEETIKEDFDCLLERIERGILEGSLSASLEEASDFSDGTARCSVRVFERYSFFGNNRLSLSLTLFQAGDSPVHLSAIAAGGSFGVLQMDNSIGEDAFLDKLSELLGR